MAGTSEPCGYAKLWGKVMNEDFVAYMNKTVCTLGRTLSNRDPEEVGDSQLIEIGSHKSISKHHATIEWDEEAKLFKITCFGKNGMVVDNKSYNKSEQVYLKSKSTIGIGRTSYLYFLLPLQASDEKLSVYTPPKVSTDVGEVNTDETKKDQSDLETKSLKLKNQGTHALSGSKIEGSTEKAKKNLNVTPSESETSEAKSILTKKKLNENNRAKTIEESESSAIKKKKVRLSVENKVQVPATSSTSIKASPASKKS